MPAPAAHRTLAETPIKTPLHTIGLALLLANPAVLLAAPPRADAGPDRDMMAGESITLQGKASDPDRQPITGWHWAIEASDYGNTTAITGATTPSPTFSAETPGVYVVTLVVYSDGEPSEPDITVITVNGNQQPVANIKADQTSGPSPLTVNFDASGSTEPDLQSLTYAWNFGDRDTGAGPWVSHSYTEPGTYQVTLRATDESGATALATLEIKVTKDESLPATDTAPVQTTTADAAADAGRPVAAESGNTATDRTRAVYADAVRQALSAAIMESLLDKDTKAGAATAPERGGNDQPGTRAPTVPASESVSSATAATRTGADATTARARVNRKDGVTDTVATAPATRPPGTRTPDPAAVPGKADSAPPATPASDVHVNRQQDRYVKQKTWTINLLSSTDRADADKLAARAASLNIPVEIQAADIKGEHYWRLQVNGFDSRSAAQASSATIKESLGIDEVWIFPKSGTALFSQQE